jgi:hypothetical protein
MSDKLSQTLANLNLQLPAKPIETKTHVSELNQTVPDGTIPNQIEPIPTVSDHNNQNIPVDSVSDNIKPNQIDLNSATQYRVVPVTTVPDGTNLNVAKRNSTNFRLTTSLNERLFNYEQDFFNKNSQKLNIQKTLEQSLDLFLTSRGF